MAAIQYQTIADQDFSGGIDALSPEGSLLPKHVEDALNAEIGAGGSVAKRKGFEPHAAMPYRVTRMVQTPAPDAALSLYLDSTVDVSTVASTPLLVYGRTLLSASTYNCDFSDAGAVGRWYAGFSADVRYSYPVGTSTNTLSAEAHQQGTADLMLGFAASTSNSTRNNELLVPDSAVVDGTSQGVAVTLSNATADTVNAYLYALANTTVAGTSYAASFAVGTFTPSSGLDTVTIAPGTHGLATPDILVQCFTVDASGNRTLFIPDLVQNNVGTITVGWTTGSIVAPVASVRVLLRAVASSQTAEGTAGAAATTTVSLPALGTAFLIAQPFVEVAGVWEACLPDSLSIDAAGSVGSVTFVNPTAYAARFRVVWAEAQARTNCLVLTPQLSALTTCDTEANQDVPDIELSVWGLPIETSSAATTADPRRVTAVDSYRSEGDAFLVATSGWNLLREALASDATDAAAYLLPSPAAGTASPSRRPRLRARVGTTSILAPAFHGAADTVFRSRGGWQFAGAEEGWGSVSLVTWAGTAERALVTVATPGRVLVGTTPVYVEDTNTCADLLTLTESVHRFQNGTFAITAVDSSDPNQLVFTVRMPGMDSADWNTTAQGRAGVFTDFVSIDLVSEPSKTWRPAVGDTVLSTAFPTGTEVQVVAMRNSNAFQNLLVGPVQGTVTLPASQVLTFRHTGLCLGLRTLDATSTKTVDDVVVGDVLSFSTGAAAAARRAVRRVGVTGSQGFLEVSADGTEATFEYSDLSTTTGLRQGQVLYIAQAGRLCGEWAVLSVESSTSFRAAPLGAGAAEAAASLGGAASVRFYVESGYVTLNYEGTFEDDDASTCVVQVDSRMVPAEFYGSLSDTLPAGLQATTRHFEASALASQPPVRTSMAADNMLATNGQDPVLKFDGAGLSRAGLPRWQPGLFVLKSASAQGIQMPPDTTTGGAVTSGVFVCTTAAQASQFKDGQSVVTSTGQYLTVRGDGDATTGKVRFVETVTGAPVSLSRAAVIYRYYFRAHAVDAAGNILATATSGADDFVVQLTTATQVRLRLVGLPAFPGLDFDRVQLQVYRTKAGGIAPFYRVATLDVDYSSGASYSSTLRALQRPYIDFSDAVPDTTLTEADPLVNAFTGNTALTGTFAGIEPPPRASLLTVIGGRAVYGNLRSWPRITAELVPAAGVFYLAESWVVRKDSADTGTSSNLTDRIGIRFGSNLVPSGVIDAPGTVSAVASDGFTFNVPGGLAVALGYTPAAGQWVYLSHTTTSTTPLATFSGWWQIAEVPTADTIRVRCTGLSSYVPSATNDCTRAYFCDAAGAALQHVPVWLGDDPNFYTREGYTGVTGDLDKRRPDAYVILRRAAAALNAVQHAVDRTQVPGFLPWLAAFAGAEQGGNVLQLEFASKALPTVPELQLGVSVVSQALGGFVVVGNDSVRAAGSSIGAVELLRPSRLAVSYANFPEAVDRPFAADAATQSFSAIDVNPSDGQGLTALMPFFGESAYNAAQTGGVLIAFKQDSIYAVDLATRQVQRLETQGVGCAAPQSPCLTRQGIVFAHTSGLYRLTRNLTVEPIGARVDRLWKQRVRTDATGLTVMQGHTWAASRAARVFFAAPGESLAREALSYTYTAESTSDSPGAWTRLDNHRPTNFCNLGSEAYFGTWGGRIMRLLTAETPESYRDDGAAVGRVEAVDTDTGTRSQEGTGFRVTLRATDFGDAGVRKRVLHALAAYRMPTDADGLGVALTGVSVEQAVNLVDDWHELDRATLLPATSRDGMTSRPSVRQLQVRYAPAVSKASWFQLRFTDVQASAPVELVGVSYRVVGLSSKGTPEAAQT